MPLQGSDEHQGKKLLTADKIYINPVTFNINKQTLFYVRLRLICVTDKKVLLNQHLNFKVIDFNVQ